MTQILRLLQRFENLVLGVDFQNTRALHTVVALGGREHALHAQRHAARGHQARRRIGQARRGNNLLHLTVQRLRHGTEQVRVVLLYRFGVGFLIIGTQVQFLGGNVFHLFAIEGLHELQNELVNGLVAQKHVVALVQHGLHQRRLL